MGVNHFMVSPVVLVWIILLCLEGEETPYHMGSIAVLPFGPASGCVAPSFQDLPATMEVVQGCFHPCVQTHTHTRVHPGFQHASGYGGGDGLGGPGVELF